MPSLPEIELIGAHCESYSRSCSKTMRTARSRTSVGYLVALLMAPSSQGLEPPRNPAIHILSTDGDYGCSPLDSGRASFSVLAVTVSETDSLCSL